LEAISVMNNKVEFAPSTHNFILRKVIEGENHQLYKNMTSNVQASCEATRKKRFMSLDLEHSQAPSMATSNETPTTQKSKRHQREGSIWKTTSTQGSIDNIVALKQTTHE